MIRVLAGLFGALGLGVLVWSLVAEPELVLPDHGRTPIVRPVPGRVLRLVPRLANSGRTAADVAARERSVAELELRPGAARVRALGGRIADPATFEAPAGSDLPRDRGIVLAPVRGTASGRAALVLEGLDWNAARIDEVRATVLVPRGATTRLSFRTEADDRAGLPAGAFRPTSHREAEAGRPRVVELVYDLSGHPSWRGRVESLRLELAPPGWPAWVESVRAVGHVLRPGTSAVSRDGELQDAGLVELGREGARPDDARYEMRRTLPALARRAQTVALEVPDGARLAFATALPPRRRGAAGDVYFEVVAGVPAEPWRGGVAPDDEWRVEPRTVWSGTLDPDTDGGLWHAHAVELAPAPQTVLWFRARGGAEDGELAGLWGAVRVSVPAPERPPSVLVVTADTLRMDHVGAYGLLDVETPNLDALAARGALFTDCLAASNSTSPSHASLFTGLPPRDHRVRTNLDRLPEGVPTLAERMAASGRTTFSASAVRHLDAQRSGLGQGVDVFFNTPPTVYARPEESEGKPPLAGRPGYRSASAVNADLLEFLGELGDEPFYGWAHYYDVHTPYLPEADFAARYDAHPSEPGEPDALDALVDDRLEVDPGFAAFAGGGESSAPDRAALRRRYERDFPMLDFTAAYRDTNAVAAAYRAEVAQLDRDLGALLERLRELGRLEDTVIVFTSDHGESLGERRIWFDHAGLFDNTLRVPLILAGPGVPAGLVVDAPAAGVDLVATLADLLDLPGETVGAGSSLLPALRGEEPAVRERWFLHGNGLELGLRADGVHALLSRRDHVRGTSGLRLHEGRLELYDLTDDPGQRDDVAAAEAALVERLRVRFERWLEDAASFGSAPRSALDVGDEEALRALGYVGD